jgi:hypothetical protein
LQLQETLPEEGARCQSCGNLTLVPGHLVLNEGYHVLGFAPAATRSDVRLRVAFHACNSCGHVCARVAPDELRSSIETHGSELIKQQLTLSDHGRYHELPDILEARQAADGVAEIDALVLAGNGLEAVRRFRQITGKTWDEVHATISHWADLTRARKLALFGWRRKGKLDDETDDEQRDHPMHDRVLDG